MNNRIYFLLLLLISTFNSLKAQVDTNLSKKNALKNVEIEAEFIGGEESFYDFLRKELKYPKQAVENNIQGRVLLEFVVCEDGSVCDYKVLNNMDKSLANEALRVVKKIPKWKPAMQNNKAVSCYFTLPITFELEDAEPKKKKKRRNKN